MKFDVIGRFEDHRLFVPAETTEEVMVELEKKGDRWVIKSEFWHHVHWSALVGHLEKKESS